MEVKTQCQNFELPAAAIVPICTGRSNVDKTVIEPNGDSWYNHICNFLKHFSRPGPTSCDPASTSPTQGRLAPVPHAVRLEGELAPGLDPPGRDSSGQVESRPASTTSSRDAARPRDLPEEEQPKPAVRAACGNGQGFQDQGRPTELLEREDEPHPDLQ